MIATLQTLHTDGRIIFSFPEEALPRAEQASFIAFIKAEWTARQSQFSKKDADTFAEEVDATWWASNRQRILAQIDAE
jgi:hypothetical protein